MSTDAIEIVDEKTAVDGNVATDVKPAKKGRHIRLTDEELRKQWEEIQATKKVIETGVKGTVKWYSILGHYGFIARSDIEGDIFVHQSAIAVSRIEKLFLRTLADGEEVEFDIVEGKNGLEAANVSGPERTAVKGAKAFRILLGSRFNNRKNENKENVENPEAKDGSARRRKTDGGRGENQERSDESRGTRRTQRPRSFSKKNKKDVAEEASARRTVEGTTISPRCDSGLGDHEAGLGATSVDAQI
ncbi:unnamed protein product [Auanema sp. JU1783]|nr:unnamed protein product [Auanema sp. JU1783]